MIARGRSGGGRREDGFVLALAVILLAFLAALAFGFSLVVESEVRVAAHHGMGAQAYWTAAAGLERGWARLFRTAPGTGTWTESQAYRPADGAFTGNLYSCRIDSVEDATAGAAAFGDIRVRSAAAIDGYGEVRAARTLQAVLPNLANDDDGNPATAPIAGAATDDGTNPARLGNDGSTATAWTAARTAASGDPQWLSVSLAAGARVRKVQFICPDSRITAYEVQVDSSGWKAVSNPSATTATSGSLRITTVVFDEESAAGIRILIGASSAQPRIAELKAWPAPASAVLSEPGS